jgi:hypothetical protein
MSETLPSSRVGGCIDLVCPHLVPYLLRSVGQGVLNVGIGAFGGLSAVGGGCLFFASRSARSFSFGLPVA